MFESQTLFIAKFISFHTWFVLFIVLAAVVSYAWEKISLELTSILTLSSLMIFFYLFPLYDYSGNQILNTEDILIGFANPALITIVSLLIIGQAIIQSNALNIIPDFIMKISNNNANIAIVISLLVVIIISAFMNNTPVVVIFIPILANIAKKLTISPSKVMIPLSYAAILGGMITLIGSSTNLLVSGAVVDLGLNPIQFFEFAVPGTIMAIVGMIYILLILPQILPDRTSGDGGYVDDRPFVSQIVITKNSNFIGKRLKEGCLPDFPHIVIRVIERNGKNYLPPFQDNMELAENDVLAISGTREILSSLVHKKSEIFLKNLHINEDSLEKSEERFDMDEANLAELVIAPASRMIGDTIKKAGFFDNYKCSVIGIQRKGNLIKSKISGLRLIAGDVLLVMGDNSHIIELRNSKDVILTKWSMQQTGSVMRAVKTLSIFAVVIITSALKLLPIAISSFSAAALLILLKCINIGHAARSIDRNVSLMIVASIALGSAMQATGGAALLASFMIQLMQGLSSVGIIAVFFIFIVIMTNILSNATTAILFTPIAVNIAIQLGVDPKLFIYAVIFACNCSFITPIGYQTNLLVMSPGKYKFFDFMRGGMPLAVIMCITYCFLVNYYF